MRLAASVFDTASSLISSSPYMPMSQHPDNDDDIELLPLTSRESPRASSRTGARGSPGRPRDAAPAQRRSLLQVPSLTTIAQPQSSSISLQWLKQCLPFAFVKRQEASARHVVLGAPNPTFARNVTRNQKYAPPHFSRLISPALFIPPCICSVRRIILITC